MAVNKIKISTSTRKILNKTKRTLGMKGENLQEVLLFDLDKKIEGNAIVEIELPDGTQSFVELTETENGYELPVKSILTEQVGFVKFQLRILQNKVEVFKSEIFELEVKESLNAIYEEPEEYPTWLDKLEDLQTELNNSEKERVSNENERIKSEEARKENFTQMQESVESAISNIKDLTENYNSNAAEKTNEFNKNYTEKKKAFDDNYSETLKSFNDNAETKYDNYNKNVESKTSEYNKNNDEKLKAYNDNHTTKLTNFNTNAKTKTDEYNSNASEKLEDYNSNDTTKTEKYNENATTKLNDYNSNATTKKEEYDTNVESKIAEFNNNATEKLDEYNQNAESLTNRVIECESENERLREDIKNIAIQGEASGENIHIEDSSNARCELEICGNHSQETREGYNLFDVLGLTLENQDKGVTVDRNNDGYIIANGTSTQSWVVYLRDRNFNEKIEDGETYTLWQENYSKVNNGGIYLQVMITPISGGENIYINSAMSKKTFKVDKSKYTYQSNIQISTLEVAGTFDNYKNRYMIYKGTEAKKFELYGASPSMNFPSEVKSVGENVNYLNNTLKSQTINGLEIIVNEDKSVKVVGTATANTNIVFDVHRKTIEAGSYIIKDCQTFIESEENHGWWYSGENKIFNSSGTLTAYGFYKYYTSGSVVNEILYPKLEKGSVATLYSPSGMGSAKTVIENENLFNSESVKSTSAIDVIDNKNGVLELQGKSGYWASLGARKYFDVGKKVYVKCKVLRLNEGASAVLNIMDSNGKSITENHKVNGDSISCDFISKGLTTIDFRCNGNSNVGHIKYYDIMVSYEDTDYVQHEEQSYLVDVQQEMLDGDKFLRQENKWYEKHNWKKVVFNGTENFKLISNNRFQINLINEQYPRCINNYFAINAISNIAKGTTLSSLGTITDNYRISANDDSLYFKINESSMEDFKAKLKELYDAGTPVVAYYKLAEPILLECTEAQTKVLNEIYNKAHTYKNITNISAESAEVNPIVNLKYLKDTETEHNKLQSQIDEIKQLLSTTQTSSMLLNNLQTDLESEV